MFDRAAYYREYYKRNREKLLKKQKEYNEANKEQVKNTHDDWVENNRKKVNEYNRTRYNENIEISREQVRLRARKRYQKIKEAKNNG